MNFKVGGNVARYSVTGSTKKKANIHNSEELIQKVWESVRSNNGIMVRWCNYALNNYVSHNLKERIRNAIT